MTINQNQASTDTIQVLHIDDEQNLLLIATRMMTFIDPRLHIESTTSPSEALEKIKNNGYDCIVSDYSMPAIDGIELAERIREVSNVPIILYTGQGSEEVAERAFEVGIDDYIRKEMEPAHYQVLVKRIRAAVEKYRVESDLMDFKLGIDSSDEAIFVADLEGVIKYINPAFEKIYGFSSREAVGKTPRILKSGIVPQEIYDQFWDKLLAKQVVTGEIINKTKDGRLLTMFSSANPILNKKGKITGFLTIQRDLTERKRIEKELVEREKRYRKVSELVSDYAYSTRFKPDGSKLLEWVTDSFTKIFGFTLEEASDRSIWEKQHYPEDLPIIEERLQRLLSNEEVISEYRLITRDGDVKWVRDYGYPEWDEGENRVVGVYGAVQDITERKRMEEEVQGLARFPSENTSPVMRISNDGVIMYVNDASKSLLNEWNTEIGSAVPEEWRHYVSEVLSEGAGKEVEVARKDRIFAFNIIPITDSGYVNVYGRDITKRKRMEEAVQSSEERWRALVELAPDGIVTVDLKGFITTINDAFEKLTGFSREEIVGKHFTRIGTLRVSDIHRYVKVFASLVKGDVPPSFDFIFKRKDGSEGWAESQFRLIEIDGKKRELFAVVRDVSERKMIEQKTLKYQERLEALHRSSFRLSKHNHVDKIFVESMEIVKDVLGFRYLGIAMIKGDEIVFDNSVGAYQSGDFRIPLNQPSIVGRVFKTGKAELLSDTRLDPDYYYDQETDENEQRLSELAVPVVIDGRVIAVIDIESVELGAFDSNDQRLVEILANHIASAINRIYSQQRLEELREKQHDELVGGIQRVSSMVRHDLRGPLQTIMNATYLMEKNPETIAEMRTLINSSIINANDIMEDWKNQGINEQLTQSDTGIQTLIENALETSLIPSNVKVSQNIESSILHLDRIKTRRVLDNLIRNAVEAMPEGGALSFKGRVDGDVYVLEVKDTGVGISEADLSRVFTPFYSTKPDGMGLGLAFCKRTVEAHAGSIEVESEVGEGTKFTISIPRASM